MVHSEDDSLLAKVPAAQIEHVAEAVPLYLPVLQSEQAPEEEAEYFPAGQLQIWSEATIGIVGCELYFYAPSSSR